MAALLMTVLMVLQQKMTPSNMDPAQQKMMMAMPFIMLIFLYNLRQSRLATTRIIKATANISESLP